jgi:hypothetical protein
VRVLDAAPLAKDMDRVLASERQAQGGRAFHARVRDLPDGAMVAFDDAFWLVQRPGVRRWSFSGYDALHDAPTQPVAVLTPQTSVDILAAGFQVRLHGSAARR